MGVSNRQDPQGDDASFRQIVEATRHVAIITTDPDGKITYCNPAAEDILRWRADEAAGAWVGQIFTPEDIAAGQLAREMRTALEQGVAHEARWHLRRNGERFWAACEMTPLRDAGGRAIGFVKFLRDRSDQKAQEARVNALTARLGEEVATRTRERDRLWRTSLDLLLEIDPQGVLRAVNPAWKKLLGYAHADLVDRHFAPFVHPDDVAPTVAAITRAASGPLVDFEIRVRHKDGGYRIIAWTAAPEAGMIYANGRDVTVERRQAEQLQAQDQARLRMAMEAARLAAWEWDMRSGELAFLHGANQLHGRPAGETPIRLPSIEDYIEMVLPEDRPHLQAQIRRALEEGDERHVEYRIRLADGSVRWLEARGMVMYGEDGRPVKMHGVTVDVTRRKRAEQDAAFLAEASAALARLVDPQSTLDKLARLAVPRFADWCAIDLLREDGSIVRASMAHVDPEQVRAARELSRRFPPGPSGNGTVWKILRSGEPLLVPDITDELLAAVVGTPEHREALRRIGIRSYIGAPLVTHGRVMGVVSFVSAESGRKYRQEDLALATDLAQRAAVAIENATLYQAVQKADRDKDVFLATLAHELRNPLAAISNGVALIELAPDQPARVRHAGAIMQRQIGQLARLVDDLLDVARISTGKIALQRSPVRLAAIVESAIEVSRPLIDGAGHLLNVQDNAPGALVDADTTRLTQVFANLLNNAARYTPPGGRIAVTLESDGAEHVARVRDNGIGIAADTLPHIFTLFAQADHPHERGAGGLGIGLSLVERLVRMHGGSVSAHSAGPGSGSEFVVRLPAAHAPGVAGDGSGTGEVRGGSDPASWWHGRRVVVVDDNEDAALTIADVLRMFGAEVSCAHDGAAALDAVRASRPDIVLLDIGLPRLDGYEVARRLREDPETAGLLLVALTGWGQDGDRERARQAGFDRHWVKPVTLEQLRSFGGQGASLTAGGPDS